MNICLNILQGREWLTSWVALTDTYPVIIQFDILPLVDIGGTLDINVKLEMEKVIIEISYSIERSFVTKKEFK